MPYAEAFTEWDPWDGERLPDTLPWSLWDVRDRACKILIGRDQQALQQAAESIYRMNSKASDAANYEIIKKMRAEAKSEMYISDLNSIRYGVEHFTLDDFPLFENARPADYFAVFALATIGELLNEHREAERQNSIIKPVPWTYSADTSEVTTTALEAVTYAERLLREQVVVSEDHAEAGRVGGKHRAELFTPLRDECIRRAKAHHLDKPSALKAAEAIYDSLEPEWLDVFQSYDSKQRTDTIAIWLRKELQFG